MRGTLIRGCYYVALLVAALGARRACGQPFVILADQGAQGVSQIASGGTLTMTAEAVGAPVQARLTISYRGNGTASISTIDRTGSNDFSFTSPTLPVTLASNESFTVIVRFVPGSGARVTGRLSVNFTETIQASQTTGTLIVNLAGVAPEFVISYTLPGGNALPVADGGTIAFPPTPLATTATAVIAILNRGSATGTVSAVSVSGDAAFATSGVPLPPVAIEAGRELRFNLGFTPRQREPVSGALRIEFPGRTVTIALQGSGAAALFSYTLIRDSQETPVQPGQTIALGEVALGQRTVVTIRIRNAGNADGMIQTISVLGPGYQLADLPFLPLTLAPGASVTFGLVAAPVQPGPAAGRLRIGNDTFDLTAIGLGAALNYTVVMAGASTPVSPNGSILFSPQPLGQSFAARFVIANAGNLAAVISAIFVSGSQAFSLSGLPELPLTLEPGAMVSFLITFAPVTVGVAQAVLRVGPHSFDLMGSATSPLPLPAIRLEGPQGQIQPLQQPAYTLSLAEPYPLNLTGTLTLTFNSEVFVNDATVQFATGGRTVNFTIPAGTLAAVFPNRETQIRLQTGSVAGTITLTPSFFTETGVNLTPASPPVVRLVIPQAPPQLVGVQLGGRTANSFTLLVTGYSTSRSVSRIELQATAAPGVNLSNARLTLDVEAAFLSWYQNVQSQQFGSMFTAVVPVSIEGNLTSGSLVDTVQSVTVTLYSALGASAPRSIELR